MAEHDYIEHARGLYSDGGCQMGDHLYFIHSAAGFIKIGRSVSIRNRLVKLRSGSPHALSLLMWLPGMGWQEGVWHAAFPHFRHRLEWFEDAPALRTAINAARIGDEWIATLEHPCGGKAPDHVEWEEHIADLEELAWDAASRSAAA